MKGILKSFRELGRYPSAVAGLVIIFLYVAVAIVTVVTLPYNEAIVLWRGGEEVWYKNPRLTPPTWINFFRSEKLAESMSFNSANGEATKEVVYEEGVGRATITYNFDFEADSFPQELILYFKTQFNEKKPYASVYLIKPDGTEVRVGDFSVEKTQTYRFSQDAKLQRRLGGVSPEQGLFAVDPKAETLVPMKGNYTLRIDGLFFEEGNDMEAELILHGQVSGWAGTDHLRRDLGVALLWGIPIAMSFGLLAALGTTITTMTIAAIGVWVGGWFDELIQRITEVNSVLPFLPILIMIGTFYTRSIWTILGATIVLSIFGLAIKNYRSTFMQIKESAYIEAARSYGAGGSRIIFLYLIPRLIPLIIPGLVTGIPAYVFLEASLAVLGLGDPMLPTWGKVINDAQANGALFKGLFYWVLEPAALLMICGLAFAMVGFSLDRIFNPRLRGI
ncbi:MAG: ABC transporter permease [Anaerolineales bacterium]|jgi:peptide/nickel transport system permease protein|nr:ABC transporter permease [Anaerolineales bacterium]